MKPIVYAFLPSIVALLGGVVFGIRANSDSAGMRKGKHIRAAWSLLGCSLSLLAFPLLVFNWRQPVVVVDGTISSTIVHTAGRNHPTDLVIQMGGGVFARLRASDRSAFFHAGQRIRVKYQKETGIVLHADFLSRDGKFEGAFNGTDIWWPYAVLISGLLTVWFAVTNYRRDPEGRSSSVKFSNRRFTSGGNELLVAPQPAFLHNRKSVSNQV